MCGCCGGSGTTIGRGVHGAPINGSRFAASGPSGMGTGSALAGAVHSAMAAAEKAATQILPSKLSVFIEVSVQNG